MEFLIRCYQSRAFGLTVRRSAAFDFKSLRLTVS